MKTIFVLIILLYSLLSPAQTGAIDSLKSVLQTQRDDSNKVNTLNGIFKQLMLQRQYDSAFPWAGKALSLSKKINFQRGLGTSYEYLGWYYEQLVNYPEALRNYDTCLKIRLAGGSKAIIAKTYDFIAGIYSAQSNFPAALKNVYAELKIYEAIGDTENIAKTLQFLGEIHNNQGNTPEALKDYSASLQIWKAMDSKKNIANCYANIGNIYSKQQQYPEALEKCLSALSIYRGLDSTGADYSIPWCYSLIAIIYKEQGYSANRSDDHTLAKNYFYKALEFFFKSLQATDETIYKESVAAIHIHIGNIYIELAQFSKAKNFLEKGLDLSKAIGSRLYVQYAYSSLTNLYIAQGDYRNAYEHYSMYVAVKDSIFGEENARNSLQEKLQYEFDKKQDSTRAAQDKKDALSIAELQNQKLFRNFSIAGIFLVVSFGGYSFYRYRRRRKLQSEQEMLNERLRISRELHDDMGSTLGSISIYSEVAKNRSAKNENADEVILKIGAASRELIEKMSDIVWSVNPNNESFEQLKNRMQSFAAMILTPHDIQYEFAVDEETATLKLSSGQRKNIFLVFKEAIHNIAKYAECTKVYIQLSCRDKLFTMKIKDNGKGFDGSAIKAPDSLGGNGIKNMRARAESMGAVFRIDSGTKEGTVIELNVNI